MANKILRPFPNLKTRKDTIEDWQDSIEYVDRDIEVIDDPDGESAHREITSIPSPFARIDLLKTAFQRINKKEAGGK
ncbi:MAG: hypothetical protein LUG51_09930 [Tannerellaceae bacterium]|nr:hypothetical protein [Tannerellaceae bacterium]